MKKVIKRGLDLILCAALISSISFCFAWSDVSQYADTDVMEMSLSDLASLRTVDSRIKDQLSETQQDYDFLLQYSSSSAMLNEWTVYDLQTAATLNTNETGHNATFTKPVNGASESYVTSNYTNLYFNREVCLAYDKQSNRAPTGTTILNARWSQVYLYTPSNGYGLWGTAATTFAHKTAQTSTLANKVSVSITTKWSEDTTNILYQ